MLYVLKWQKEHKRAFFVCTLRMCASIARFVLGAMSQFPHLYIYSRGPNFIIIGVSINPDPDAPTCASCWISSSSIGSSFTGVEGPCLGEAGVGVVALFSCLKSWGNSPGPTSSHVPLKQRPAFCATILCPAATIRTAENACIDSVNMNTIELITFRTNLCRQCRHEYNWTYYIPYKLVSTVSTWIQLNLFTFRTNLYRQCQHTTKHI